MITAPAGHVATTVLPVGADTHTVENSYGELATDALLDAERVALPVRDGMKPVDRDADADRDTERDTEGDLEGERVDDCATMPGKHSSSVSNNATSISANNDTAE